MTRQLPTVALLLACAILAPIAAAANRAPSKLGFLFAIRDATRWYIPYCLREARHLLRDNPVHLNITSFGFTKPSESKNPSRRLIYLLRSPGGQFPHINPNGVF